MTKDSLPVSRFLTVETEGALCSAKVFNIFGGGFAKGFLTIREADSSEMCKSGLLAPLVVLLE